MIGCDVGSAFREPCSVHAFHRSIAEGAMSAPTISSILNEYAWAYITGTPIGIDEIVKYITDAPSSRCHEWISSLFFRGCV